MKSYLGCFSSKKPIHAVHQNPSPRLSFEEQKFTRSPTPYEPLPLWNSLSSEEKVIEVAVMINREIADFLSKIESPPSLCDLQADFTSLRTLPSLLQLLLVRLTCNVTQEKSCLKKKKVLTIGHMIMKARDSRKTTSFMLASSLVLYSLSGSRYILDLLDSLGVGVSYASTKKFLKDYAAKNPPNIGAFQNADVVFWADNVQSLSGSSRSSVVRTFSVSLVTNRVAFLPVTAVQFDSSCDPMAWRHVGVEPASFDLSPDQLLLVNGHMEKVLDEMWQKEAEEAEEKQVAELQKLKEEDEKQRKMKTCACGASYPKGKRKCDIPSCGLSLPKAQEPSNANSKSMEFLKDSAIAEKKRVEETLGPRITMYYPKNDSLTKKSGRWNSFEVPNSAEKPEMSLPATPYIFMDPIDVNPGSEDGIRVILRQAIEDAGPNRKIIPIVLDGGPLRLAHKLLRQEPDVFGRILPIPGAGHEELTMLRAFFNLVWCILGEEFAISHGYKTDSQQKYLRGVGDTHKGIEAHDILMEGLWREAIHIYHRNSGNPAEKGKFSEFLKETIFSDLIFHGTMIQLFHQGVRQNNFEMAHAARVAFLPMWWTCSHPVYRLVIPAFVRDFRQMPELLQGAVKSWIHGSVTGTKGKYEGLDFVGESFNRLVMAAVPSKPTFTDWEVGVRTENVVSNCREKLEEFTGKVPSTSRSKMLHVPDVLSWREALRKNFDLSPKTLKGKRVQNTDVFAKARRTMSDFLDAQFRDLKPFSKSSLTYNAFFPKVESSESTKECKEEEEGEEEEVLIVESESEEEDDLEILLAKQLSLEIERNEEKEEELSKEEEMKRKREERREKPDSRGKRRRRGQNQWYADLYLTQNK